MTRRLTIVLTGMAALGAAVLADVRAARADEAPAVRAPVAPVTPKGAQAPAAEPAKAVIPDELERSFITARGMKLMLVPIDGMGCEEMEIMLARIDSTEYRKGAPEPHDAADAPLFEYELTLAEETFRRCVARLAPLNGVIATTRPASGQDAPR